MTCREFRDLASLGVTADDTAVPLDEAVGRTLARRVNAPIDVPGFDRAAMDSYDVRVSDTFNASERKPIAFSVTGVVQAGEEPTAAADAA